MTIRGPVNTDDLTGSVKLFAERLEPRLQAGAKTFQAMRLVVASLAPLVLAAFAMGAYSMTMARKGDVAEQGAAEQAHHADLERRTLVLEDARKSELAARAAAEIELLRRFEHFDKRLDEIFILVGAQQPSRGAHR